MPGFWKILVVLSVVLFGTAAATAQDMQTYRGAVQTHIEQQKRYPSAAIKTRDAGVAIVSFVIDPRGRVTHVSIKSSSGSAILDRETIAMVRRASPFPPPPDGKPKRMNAPVRYRYAGP